MIQNKKILILGGAGSIGSELTRQLAKNNQIYILDINEVAFFDLYEELRLEDAPIKGRVGDIRNLYTLENVFFGCQPDIVFHLAALKCVTPAEHDPREYIETNAVGTCNVVETAKRTGVEKLIFTSSDKAILDDKIYGSTKRLGELIVKNADYTFVRFGNVLGSRGSVLPIWDKQIKEGKPITITDKRMERYFMTIPEACHLLIEAAEMENGKGLVMKMGNRFNLYDIAVKVLNEMGKPDYPIREIGARPGETFIEELMTKEEKERAVETDKFWVI